MYITAYINNFVAKLPETYHIHPEYSLSFPPFTTCLGGDIRFFQKHFLVSMSYLQSFLNFEISLSRNLVLAFPKLFRYFKP